MKTNSLEFDAQALREKILDLAMRGKLVPQDPDDEPASVLLEKIKAEKAELIKEKKIKKTKPLPMITDDEKPFDIPDSWEWVRLGDVLSLENGAIRRGPFGSSLKKAYFVPKSKNTYKVYEQGNAIHKSIDYGSYYISPQKFEELKSFAIRPKDVIISGAGTIGKTYILPDNAPEGVINQALIRVRLNNSLITNEYFLLAFQQKVGLLNKRAKGTAIKNMFSISHMKNDLVWALPPLSEQSRIAAKIAQLFALLRKVESSTQQYAKLQILLKFKVLDLAMRGKLVKQDPNDESASVLLEKEKLKSCDEKPHDIPASWKWIVLGSGVNFYNGRAYKKNELLNNDNLTPVLRVGNLFTNSSWYYSDLKLNPNKYINNGDLIYAWSASFGPKIWNGGRVIYHYHIWKVEYNNTAIDKNFLYYFLLDKNNVVGETDLHGSTMKHITKTNMEQLPFPLPPLLEQSRIAAKVTQLFDLFSKVDM